MKCPNCGLNIAKEKGRSNQENRYFHGVVVPIIAEYTGYSLDDAKDILKSMFLKDFRTIKTRKGFDEISIVRGSSELSTAEFEKFMADVREWASAELGVYIPLPNETEPTCRG